jgi:spore maturation protein CgeB
VRILRVTSIAASYLGKFYRAHPGLDRAPYAAQREALDRDAFGWADFWTVALAPLGYEVMDVAVNARALQGAWWREQGIEASARRDPEAIVLEQARRFQPDVLWFDHGSEPLLRELRAAVPSVRLVLGWSGSALAGPEALRHVDLMLSCAPEAVATYRGRGMRAEQLHHGFDPRVLARLHADRPKRWRVAFSGQLLGGGEYHATRERLLSELVGAADLAIFSSAAEPDPAGWARIWARRALHGVVRGLRAAGVAERWIRRAPLLGRAAAWRGVPAPAAGPRLRRRLRPAVYGLEMYQTLRDSEVTLNIHADTSPRYASNMRLFEATGVGSCLLTDWKENLGELFEPEREVATYRNGTECLEKIQWLLAHPAEREAIAAAGQRRTLRDHTVARRAMRLDALIRKAMEDR